MSLIKWEPFDEIEQFFGDRTMPSFLKLSCDLAVDVYEEKGNVVAKMSLPDVKADDLSISIEDDVLTIIGRREEEKETAKKDYYSKEIKRGSFARTVHLPKVVDAKKAEANYKDGILSVTMPVIAGAKDKSVKVKIKK
ncbi:hypothetical protein COU14_00265 [Candidatus Kaiserbacteria bacterium CG10_big_fil_rev_8_21_14_0_10_44_10]|uniref:SHSP domain-containing protein n=1 Tax=Candidatus Kaiserbacteria bacterium CG10_big_fil_rev_8_21_14_0_10_44_10 TaxID=1974606 RepID=A0A2H0UIH8_9BACT|nr:MAG: hypothetical protein COU14_00265 [Candidatus Kaiserbacteria bacterium CG10_big_fil_rev_8_21_14_0_10_44_10]